ncbi:MAG: FTR1 family protein [Candidatus Calescibacterium sp.]|nr:FTR1 family protein [Candidatus Calescibacterium sp.]MDW8088081.1 FTR1 family protein [Candidatus Calescibacterium sp.]
MKIIIKISEQKIGMLFGLTLFTFLVLSGNSLYADEKFQKMFLLTNYISSDYENAVKDGQIVSEFEYDEMKEFCNQIMQLSPNEIKEKVKELCDSIEKKESTEKIKEITSEILSFLGKKGAISPTHIPEFNLGRKLYTNLCISCHGKMGEGIEMKVSSDSPPPPAPLTSPHISPTRVYLTTKFGIEGTTMPAFSLSEKERWSLSFYVAYLKYMLDGQKNNSNGIQTTENFDLLFEYGLKSNEELEQIFGEKAGDIRKKVFELKNLDVFKSGILKAIEEIDKKNNDVSSAILTKSYMIFEEIEPELKVRNQDAVVKIELLYQDAILSMKEGKDNTKEKLNEILKAVEEIEKQKDVGKTIASFIIVFREGLEAIIIVSAILGVVSAASISQIPIYIGALSGIIGGILLWEITGKIISINREIMEGVFTITAVLVIIWVSLWILEKTRKENLKKFIDKVKNAAFGRKYLFLMFLSFLATSREAGETVLFLRALGEGIEKGVIIGFISLFAVAFAIYILKMKLDTIKFFILTNIILNIVAVVLLGKAIVEFQEAGLIPISFVNIPQIEIIGIYPTLQTLIPQIILFLALFGATIIYLSKGRPRQIAK